MIKIRVPASSANMGPGFDSLGVALKLYNYIYAEEIPSGLEIRVLGDESRFVPRDGDNLVFRMMSALFERVGHRPRGLRLVLENNIPMTRGLGSSSACIVGGLYAANILAGSPLTKQQLLDIAAIEEGHADNVTPAMMGGFTVSVKTKDSVRYISHSIGCDLKFAAFIPDFALSTKRARMVLPRNVSHRDAAFNAGHSALLAASLITGDYENIRTAIGDRLHQSYRRRLVPGMDDLFRLCRRHGALGVYLSGAGPTVMAIIRASNKDFHADMSRIISRKMNNRKLCMLDADNSGVTQID